MYCTKRIVRAITTTRNISFLRNCDKKLSYTSVRENILDGLPNVEFKHKRFGMHSLRSGATNLGVKDRLFRKHGRWKLEKVKDGYTHEILPNKLIVTKSLGL